MSYHWINKKLSEVAEIIMGQSPSSKTYNIKGEGMPFFQGKADFGFIFPNVRTYCTMPLKVARKNDILLSVRAPVGPVNLCNTDSCIGRGLTAIRAKSETNYLFLYYYLIYIRPQIESLGTGSTFQAINKSKIENLEIPLPPLSEQKKIAAVLSTVQKAIEIESKLIERTKELKKSTMHKLFTEGTKGEKQKITEIGPIPESWEVVRLGDLIKITSGGTPSRKIKEYYNGNHLWVKSGELEDNIILDTEEKITDNAIKNSSAKIFPKDTVLIAMYGATVGKTAILKKEATTNQAVCAILPNFEIFVPEFIKYYFIVARNELLKQRYGGAQPNISQTIIKNTLILNPPLAEQQAIADILSTIDEKIEFHTNKKQKLEELFRTLLHELMTAKIRVNDVDLDFIKIEE